MTCLGVFITVADSIGGEAAGEGGGGGGLRAWGKGCVLMVVMVAGNGGG